MKLHPSLLVLPFAGLLLVAGAGAVLATPADVPAAAPVAPAAATPTPDPSSATLWLERTDTALEDALTGLVTDGTITADQKSKILEAVTAERTARHEQRLADRQVLRDALADGEITQTELDKLSADHPLRQATDLMADGKITTDELRSLGRGFKGGMGGNGMRGTRGHGMGGRGMGGHGMWDQAPAPSPVASPAATSGTSG